MSEQLGFNYLSEVEVSLAEDGSSPIRVSEFGQTCLELFRDSNGDYYVMQFDPRDLARWTAYEMNVLFPNKRSTASPKTICWQEVEARLMKAAGLE